MSLAEYLTHNQSVRLEETVTFPSLFLPFAFAFTHTHTHTSCHRHHSEPNQAFRSQAFAFRIYLGARRSLWSQPHPRCPPYQKLNRKVCSSTSRSLVRQSRRLRPTTSVLATVAGNTSIETPNTLETPNMKTLVSIPLPALHSRPSSIIQCCHFLCPISSAYLVST